MQPAAEADKTNIYRRPLKQAACFILICGGLSFSIKNSLRKGKRIETLGKVFNPKVPQRGKRIETAAQAGAVACACRTDGSLPNAAAPPHLRRTDRNFCCLNFLLRFQPPMPAGSTGCSSRAREPVLLELTAPCLSFFIYQAWLSEISSFFYL